MIGVTLRGIAGRKIRALLTALAVVIGVAMVSGTYVLTDTFQKAFNSIFSESYAGTDAVVSGKQLLTFSSSGRAPVPAELLDEIRALPEVEAAAGGILDIQSNSNPAQLVDDDGKKIGGSGGAPTFGVGLDPSELRFSPLSLEEGKWAKGPTRWSSTRTPRANRASRSATPVGIAALGPVEQYEITGIARFGSVDSIGGATFAVFDVPTAQTLFQKEGQFDSISVAAKAGASAGRARPVARAARSRDRRGADGRGTGRRRRRGHQRGHRNHQVHLARVRRRRALRRRVRHLQHALDHRRAADARVRDGADARRLPPPGARGRSSSRGSSSVSWHR